MHLGRSVVPVWPELDAGVAGTLYQVSERDRVAVDSDGVMREAHVLGSAAVDLGGKWTSGAQLFSPGMSLAVSTATTPGAACT